MDPRIVRAEFFELMGGVLKGLNLVQQKSWSETELKHFFPQRQGAWLPYVEARHPRPVDLTANRLAWDRMATLLSHWDDPVEATVLKARLTKIGSYLNEVAKAQCDQETLRFFLGDLPLAQLEPVAVTRPFATSRETFDAKEAKHFLQSKLSQLFPDSAVSVKLSAHTLARASTGKDSIRLREDYRYSREELEQLTFHEAWVHLGTNLQGMLQPELLWLAHWHPGVTAFQEGLALISEIVGGCWTERRQNEVIVRHQSALLALRGWSAHHVYEWLRDKGQSSDSAMATVLRVFRGCSLEGGMCFGKELLYVLGLKQWTELAPALSRHDMQVALSGKMDFQEWELLRRGKWRSPRLGAPPAELLDWPKHFQIQKLRFQSLPAA